MVNTEEFERGLAILRGHDREKSRQKRRFYLLRGLLWLRAGEHTRRMYVSTSRGEYGRYYSYYLTHAGREGCRLEVPCAAVDNQIGKWLQGVSIEASLIPDIDRVYREEISSTDREDRQRKVTQLQDKLRKLREEELNLARMVLTGKISEDAYDRLRREWLEKVSQTQRDLDDLERDSSQRLDDLELGLAFLSRLPELYQRLDHPQQATLLNILVQRLFVDAEGVIVDHQLHAPFSYLLSVRENLLNPANNGTESQAGRPGDVLAAARFEHRSRLAELNLDSSQA